MSRPLTYGDLLPKLLARQVRFPTDQRILLDATCYGLGASIGGRHIPFHSLYQQENDPMRITIDIREIANGVLLTTHRGGPFADEVSPEYHYPDPSSAFAAAEGHLRETWADAADRRVCASNPLGLSSEERARHTAPVHGSFSVKTDRDTMLQNEAAHDPIMPEIGAKLPEEAAVEAMPLGSGYAADIDTSGYAQTIEEGDLSPERFLHDRPAVGIAPPLGDVAPYRRDYGDETAAAD